MMEFLNAEGVRWKNRHILRAVRLRVWIEKRKARVLAVAAVMAATVLMIIAAYIERGYFAVGGEWLLPGAVWLGYKVIQEVKIDDVD